MRSPARVTERRAALALLFAFAFVSIVFTGQVRPFPNPNELSRFEAIYSFVENGTFRIDEAITRMGDHEDKSLSGGHFYSNKAPGLAFAGIPVYRALRVFFPKPRSSFEPIFVLLRMLVVTPVCLLALARFFSRLRQRGAPAAALVTAALALGTNYLFYARSFFSHAWTAALILLSLDLIQQGEDAGSRRRVGVLLWAAGLLAGWAAISEYPLALFAGLLLVRSAIRRRSITRAVWFGVGALIPLALLLAYDASCFGSAFVLSSAREASPRYSELARHGLFGFGPPSVKVAAAYLFHPARGVLLVSPFLLWAIVGFNRWRVARENRADWIFCLAAALIFFVAMTAYPNWHGGWSMGNRYLLPLLFPVGFALPYALRSPMSRWGFAAAAVYSAAVHAVLASTWPHFPAELFWPLKNGSLWFAARGWAAPGIFGDPPLWPAAALAASLLAAAVALVPALASAGLPRGRAWLAAAAGAVLFAVHVAAPPSPNFFMRAWRAEIYGTASGRDPSFEELREVLGEAATPQETRRAEYYRRRYRLP
ncbi:MAG TPA: hypothetical protein VE007_03480 [Thermoanaerobaculia bacterium]|nr:hypothetical protein [Thermoanaerobaculia bacterium]